MGSKGTRQGLLVSSSALLDPSSTLTQALMIERETKVATSSGGGRSNWIEQRAGSRNDLVPVAQGYFGQDMGIRSIELAFPGFEILGIEEPSGPLEEVRIPAEIDQSCYVKNQAS